MKEKKTDLRIQRTQKAIIDTFYELMDEKSFNNITVTDICERALINRGTFYTHFEDKYQLLEKCISDIMYDFDTQVDLAHGDTDLATYYREVLDIGMSFVAGNRKRIKTIISKADSTLIFDKVHAVLIHNIVGKLTKASPAGGDGLPIELLAEFFAGGVVSLVKWWVLNDSGYTADQIKDRLVELALITLREYFGEGRIKLK